MADRSRAASPRGGVFARSTVLAVAVRGGVVARSSTGKAVDLVGVVARGVVCWELVAAGPTSVAVPPAAAASGDAEPPCSMS